MSHSLKTKLIAGLFAPALVFAGAAYANDTNKTTSPSASTSATTSTTTNTAGMSATDTFARLDTNHDGKLSASEAAADSKVQGMWKKLDANNDGVVSQAEFDAHKSDLK